MKFHQFQIICLSTLLLTGCAHPIKVAPDLSKIERTSINSPKIVASVGYFIAPELRALEVTTQGGGGDNVRYFPYKEIEAGFEKILTNNFTNVVRLNSVSDYRGVAQSGIDYTFTPMLVSTSGGSGLFTWPPTNFTIDLTSSVQDGAGKVIATHRVLGTGAADTGERLSEPGIAGRRAMEDALNKMQIAISAAKYQGAVPPVRATLPATQVPATTIEGRLSYLKGLRDKGLITSDEYEMKRKEVLKSL